MRTLTIAALAALIAAPAVAGGLAEVEPAPIVVAPPPAPVPASGDWAGAYVGGQLGYGDIDVESANGDDSGDGWLGGVHAGYMWDFGRTVIGVEGDYDVTDIDIGDGAGSIDNVARLKLRAGYDAGPALIYGTAGPAFANATVGGSDLSDDGWFAGIGVGYQLTDQWILGGEVLSHQFDDFDSTGSDIDATTATLRASFRF